MKYGEGKGGWCTRFCRRAHGCGLWRSISAGWKSFAKHLSFVVGDGSRILFWHDKWTRDVPLKILYPQLFMSSANKENCISEVLSPLVGDNDKMWSSRFYRAFNDWELAASYSLLHFIQTRIPRDGGVTGFVGTLMEVGSLIFGLFIIRLKMQLLLLSLGRAFGKLSFLKGWHSLCGQQLMV